MKSVISGVVVLSLVSWVRCSPTLNLTHLNAVNTWMANQIFLKPLSVEPYQYHVYCDSTEKDQCRLSTVTGRVSGLATPYRQQIDIDYKGFNLVNIELTYAVKLSLYYPNMTLTNLNNSNSEMFEGITVSNYQNEMTIVQLLDVDVGSDFCVQQFRHEWLCSGYTCGNPNRYATANIVSPQLTLTYTDPSTSRPGPSNWDTEGIGRVR